MRTEREILKTRLALVNRKIEHYQNVKTERPARQEFVKGRLERYQKEAAELDKIIK